MAKNMEKILTLKCTRCNTFAATPVARRSFSPESYICNNCGRVATVDIILRATICKDDERAVEDIVNTVVERVLDIVQAKV